MTVTSKGPILIAQKPASPYPPVIIAVTAFLAAVYGWAVFITTFKHPGAIGLNYNTPGTDYMVFYTAVRAALDGALHGIYDGDHFTALLNARFHASLAPALPFRPWIYPPGFLILLMPFGTMPFLESYFAFQLVTACALVASLIYGANAPPGARWIAAAALLCPAASINVVDGQCAFLIAALLAAGVRLLPAAPLLAGLAFGLLTFKPQFCLLVPVILVASRNIKAAVAASATAAILVGFSAAMFGTQIWSQWAIQSWASNAGADPRWFLYGRAWGHSLYTCAVLLGAPARAASFLQALALAAAAGLTYWAFVKPMRQELRIAILLPCALLAAPHWGSYDAVLLVIAVGCWLGCAGAAVPTRAWLLAFIVAIVPLLGPPALSVPARFGPLLTGLVIAAAVSTAARRGGADHDAPAGFYPS